MTTIWPELVMLRVLTTPGARLSASVSMLKEKDSRPSGPDQPNVMSVALGAGVVGLASIWRGPAEPRREPEGCGVAGVEVAVGGDDGGVPGAHGGDEPERG